MADNTDQSAHQPQQLGGVVSTGQPQGELPVPAPTANTASGSVQAFRDIRRELTEEDLKHPGVQKLTLDRLDAALARCEVLSSFESRYHDADKRVAILEEKLRRGVALDIAWGVGVSIGLTLVTLAPVMWDFTPAWIGRISLVLGALLIGGGISIRVVLK